MKINRNILIATALLCLGYATFKVHARGGDAFAGALGGSLMGGVIGNAMTRGNGGGGSSRSVDHLDDRMDNMHEQLRSIKRAFANDLRTLNKKIGRLEKQVEKLIAQNKKKPARPVELAAHASE